MKKEFIRKDVNGNDVYIILERGKWTKTLLNCYAYRKIIKKIFFIKYTVYKPIHKFNSNFLWDTRCNSFTTTTIFNEEELNKILDEIVGQVNCAVTEEQKHNKSLSLLNF